VRTTSEMMNTKAVILLSLILLLSLGCGKKDLPVSWDTIVPKRIVDLEAVSRDNRLLLQWTAPKENTDKSVLTDLASFNILRSEGDLVGDECRGCGGSPKVVYEMKVREKEPVGGKKMSLLFEELQARKVYVFTVVSTNRSGYPSSPSNPVQVYWDYAPQQPSVVNAERGDKRVDLSWEPVVGATGYNIYRRLEGEILPLNPVNRSPLTETRYTDLSVENEKRYVYTVRALKRMVKTDVEGKDSLAVPVTPTDLVPPAAPTELVAVPLKNGMELNWRGNREPDLLGYRVYRRKVGEAGFNRLMTDPIPKETFLDTDVESGQDYEYTVTAVDRSPNKNESGFSEEVRGTYVH
jgi:fibronectin type 3 domain-containing protein